MVAATAWKVLGMRVLEAALTAAVIAAATALLGTLSGKATPAVKVKEAEAPKTQE